MFWNVQNIRISPANRSLFVLRRIASTNVVSIRVSSYWFVSHRCTFVSHHYTPPVGAGTSVLRLGSRISPHRHRVVVEVHWRGAQGWRSISWVVATFNHVGGSFNLSMAATGDVWIIPSFRIWGYVLHVEHISCVITNCGQLQWAISSLFSMAL